jgi:Na+-transporting methylmalonyl-CoA/oxaloacetate decarboxylase gamma subunit
MRYQSVNFGSQIPLKTKISLAFGAILILGLLFFFAFTFFLITLVSGIALFIFNLFQKTTKNLNLGGKPKPPPRTYERPNRNDDDVIDI